MTSALGLKLQEAIETAEARKAMEQWNKAPDASISVSETTFNTVRDNPNQTKKQIASLLQSKGYNPSTSVAMLNIMLRYGLLVQEDGQLRAVGNKYTSRVEFNKQLSKKNRKVTKKKELAKGEQLEAHVQEQRKEVRLIRRPSPDAVNHPAHYKVGGIETIDFIEAKKLGFNLGNVVKYITRAEHKGNQLEDLRKAQWYLAREIERVQA
jgi:hypothetical protein